MFLNSKNIGNYTVAQLRKMTRGLIKQVNAIIYNIPDNTSKGGYMKQIAEDLLASKHTTTAASDERLTQVNVKYMRKGELKLLYNELSAFIEADRESISYAKRLAGRKDRARRKTGKTLGKRLTAEEYDQMLEMFDDYSEYMENYGYRTVVDSIRKYRKKGKGTFADKIKEVQNMFADNSITATKEKVLTYINNEDAIMPLLDKGYSVDKAIQLISTK